MNRLERAAVVSSLAKELLKKESWCGETHLQKATYLLQDMVGVPLGFEFMLYKYGPFSFELRDDLSAMRADGLLELQAAFPYGPRLCPTPVSESLQKRFSNVLKQCQEPIEFIASELGRRGVSDLEKLSTAWLVTRELGPKSQAIKRAALLREAKPHIPEDDALAAIEEVDEMSKRATRVHL